MSLDEIFNGNSPDSSDSEMVENEISETEEAAIVESTVEEQSETTSQDDDSESKLEAEKTDESEEDIEKQNWTLAAVKDERRKRQELERELEALRAEKQKSGKTELPDVFDDQSGFVDGIRQEYRQELASAKLELAREMMIDTHDDYEAMENVFINEVAKENPILAEQARKASNPAKFVYQQAKKYQEYKEMQDVDKYREKLRAELRSELEAELKQSQEQKAAKVSEIKPSLAKARATDKDTAVEEVTLSTLFQK